MVIFSRQSTDMGFRTSLVPPGVGPLDERYVNVNHPKSIAFGFTNETEAYIFLDTSYSLPRNNNWRLQIFFGFLCF